MKKLIVTLLAICALMEHGALISCTCIGRVTKNTPAFFIDEYEQETEITENIDTQNEILHECTTTTTGENA